CETARKKPVPDLAVRVEAMRKAIYALAENMRLHVQNGTVVVTATGSSEQTLKKLRFGTDWFDPNPDVERQLIAGLYT
ncbi:hypothetical protein, partial [Streptococcus pneumoniae]|uniref:hypothetical protein n=1 Tax=Streptococcus pneumoniae TaxID=1313 RepID=UPI0018B083DA